MNSELLANLGNFVNRALSFLYVQFKGVVPELDFNEMDLELISTVNGLLAEFTEKMEHVKMRDSLQQILAVSRQGNLYMQTNAPWKLVKSTDESEK